MGNSPEPCSSVEDKSKQYLRSSFLEQSDTRPSNQYLYLESSIQKDIFNNDLNNFCILDMLYLTFCSAFQCLTMLGFYYVVSQILVRQSAVKDFRQEMVAHVVCVGRLMNKKRPYEWAGASVNKQVTISLKGKSFFFLMPLFAVPRSCVACRIFSCSSLTQASNLHHLH